MILSKYSPDTSINVLWEEFKTAYFTSLKFIPYRESSSRFNQPWINSSIKRLSRRKQRLYNHARSFNTIAAWNTYHLVKKKMQIQCRKAYNCYISSLFDTENHSISKKLWTFIKNKRRDRCTIGSLKHGNLTYSDPASKANLLNNYFASVFTQENKSNVPTIDGLLYPDMEPITVYEEGVLNLLQTINIHKSCGPDKIQARMLRDYASLFAPILTLLFQASLKQGVVPNEWKTAYIVPIHKKGDMTSPGNYRPVSLTSICCKILEHIIHSCLFSHLEQHDILCTNQHGFRSGYSCETQLLSTIDDLALCLNAGKCADVILLDFKKAFDKVPHQRLFQKLYYYGIRGSTLTWIKDFLCNRTQRVVLDGCMSSSTTVSSGVPQGTVLAPLLFLCFINDLPQGISASVKLYADDVLLYKIIESTNDSESLQCDLNLLSDWANKWQMEFNPSKCEHLQVSLKRSCSPTQYYIQGELIKKVAQTKYLGVTINQHLTWNDHVHQICNKANAVIAFLKRNLLHCPTIIKDHCYKSLVRPILEYSASVWSPHTSLLINKLESIQRRAARFTCNDFGRYSSVTAMLSYLSWPSLCCRRTNARAIMTYKILNDLVHLSKDNFVPSTRGHNTHFIQPYTRIDAYKFSFFPSAVKIWNHLPEEITNSQHLCHFKQRLHAYTKL